MLTQFKFSQKEKKIHPLLKTVDIRSYWIDSIAKSGSPSKVTFFLPVYSYETQQIEIITTTKFFRFIVTEREDDIDLYDYTVSIRFEQLPPGYFGSSKSYPRLFLTRIGPLEFAQKIEINREERLKK